ncbi:MAG: ATP-binding cassette domain-containing protein, partial [Candidatus Hodarchaeales archaeon]
MVKVYTGALIDKPLRSINSNLQISIASDLKKYLKIRSDAVASQELNTFILASGQKNGTGEFDSQLIEKIEKGKIQKRFTQYYNKNEKRFRNYMKNNQELRETAQIVKDFIREIDSALPNKFETQLNKINSDLPKTFCQISSKSLITLWDIEEKQEFRFNLSAFDFPIFSGKTTESPIDVGSLVDKLLIVNFFATFLKSTLIRLDEMNFVLEKLEQEIENKHFKINNEKLQLKFELFLRILVAKLSALQELEELILRIFNLFDIPYMLLTQYSFKSDFSDLNTEIARICEDISQGKNKLHEVSQKIQRCQLCLRDYLDDGVNGITTTSSPQIFKRALKPLAELSIDLFIEAELLKLWSDYFGSDVPYFSFNVQLGSVSDFTETGTIDDDVILAVRGLYKNYNLGRTTVYAIRGVNLDIKAGEFVAIVGSSGAGKTTLLNCMASLDKPDHGTVYFRGKNLHKMKDSEKAEVRLHDMGFIFQSYALLPHFDTRENVTLPANLIGGLSKDIKNRIENLLVGVGIDQQAKQFPAQLSGGQMQRVAIARALTNQPAVIFADEPTGDLDSITGIQVMELLKKFHEETKTTIIVITHEKTIADYAERQILMEDGVITQRKTTEEYAERTVLMKDETVLPPKKSVDAVSVKIEERMTAIETQLESTASRLSELSKILENRSVDIRTGVTKDFKHQLDELRNNLEVLGLETNNKILDLSTKFKKLNINSSNWSFAVNEQMEAFRTQYVNTLEEFRQSRALTGETEKIMSQKYTELVEQLKEKERLAVEKENLNQIRISSLQDELERKERDLVSYKSRLAELDAEIKKKTPDADIKAKANFLEINYNKLKEQLDIKEHEVEQLQTQLTTMTEDTRKIVSATKAIKTFLDESESGRILNQLLNLQQVSLDELSARTGISTYSVLQVIQHFRDLGII